MPYPLNAGKNIIKLLQINILSFFAIVLPLHAQCVFDPIKSISVEGYLLFGVGDNYRTADNAEVRLLYQYYPHKAIASAPVDQDGYFALKKLAPASLTFVGALKN
jgi:hypothetical protein